MELVTGCSLSALLRERGRLPVELAVRWGAHVCAGLAAAHAVGVVHRDIKPSNLMVVDADAPDGGTVKLVDFGIAGFHEAALHQRTLPPTGEPFGTPLYVSPEQIQMLPVGAFSDLYSFGAVLFHMLTGQPPFHAAEPMPVLRMHLTEPPPNPAELRPDVPAELAELVLMLLAKDPGQRPDNALWVRDRLLSLSGTSPPASAASPTESASREAQMRRLEQSWVEAERLAAAGQAAAAAQRIGALEDGDIADRLANALVGAIGQEPFVARYNEDVTTSYSYAWPDDLIRSRTGLTIPPRWRPAVATLPSPAEPGTRSGPPPSSTLSSLTWTGSTAMPTRKRTLPGTISLPPPSRRGAGPKPRSSAANSLTR